MACAAAKEVVLPPLPKDLGCLDWSCPGLQTLGTFLKHAIEICKPNAVEIFDGSIDSYNMYCKRLVKQGSFIKLNPTLWPNSYHARSNPVDVARSEDRTFVCLPESQTLYRTPNSAIPASLGFTWGCRAGEVNPETGKEFGTEEMRVRLYKRFDGCMAGRTMLIIPYSMGPLCSEFAKLGVQITDSAYVVVNMYTMTRTGSGVIAKIAAGTPFLPCWHSVGCPLAPGEKDVAWPCRLTAGDRYIAHFCQPERGLEALGQYSIMSFGSGYGGNAILGKKCYALRIASAMARTDTVQWMAEHMLILQVRYTPAKVDPVTKKKTYGPAETFTITGAFPSACGKTNLAMLEVPAEFRDEWSVACVGDDIAWLRVDQQGRLCAINPESGFFGVAPGTSDTTNAHAMATLRGGNVVFTNVAVTTDGDVWWEGKTADPPRGMIDWRGKRVVDDSWRDADPAAEKKKKKAVAAAAAHANARYTAPAASCPIAAPDWNTGKGFPVDAMLFGGRRTHLVPLCVRAANWRAGVLAAATLRSEGTAAVQDRVMGALSFDPMAMRPFIGYNVGDYFAHWLHMGTLATNAPDIYTVNWFRKDAQGAFIWHGFTENFRVIRWACLHARQRRAAAAGCAGACACAGAADEVATPLGAAPTLAALGLSGPGPVLVDPNILSVDPAAVNAEASWFREFAERKEYLLIFKEDLPQGLRDEHNALVQTFAAAGLAVPEGAKVEDLLL